MEQLDYCVDFFDLNTPMTLIRSALNHIGAVESQSTLNSPDKVLFKFSGMPVRYHYVLWDSSSGQLQFYSYSPSAAEFTGSYSFDKPDTTALADGSAPDSNNLYKASYIQPDSSGDTLYVAVASTFLLFFTTNSRNVGILYEVQDDDIVLKYFTNPGNLNLEIAGSATTQYTHDYQMILGLDQTYAFANYDVRTPQGSIPIIPAYYYTFDTVYKIYNLPGMFVSTIALSDNSDYDITYGGDYIRIHTKVIDSGSLAFVKGNLFNDSSV